MHTYLSTQHVAAGTASYMSPETFSGGAVGEKADVWSLACMLWECVTGERPWRGLNVVQVAFQVRAGMRKGSNHQPWRLVYGGLIWCVVVQCQHAWELALYRHEVTAKSSTAAGADIFAV